MCRTVCIAYCWYRIWPVLSTVIKCAIILGTPQPYCKKSCSLLDHYQYTKIYKYIHTVQIYLHFGVNHIYIYRYLMMFCSKRREKETKMLLLLLLLDPICPSHFSFLLVSDPHIVTQWFNSLLAVLLNRVHIYSQLFLFTRVIYFKRVIRIAFTEDGMNWGFSHW